MLKTPWDFSSSTRVIQVHTVTLRALPSVGARFVVVSVYECDLTGNRLAGEVALPLQDPRVGYTSPWPLLLDGAHVGIITLSVARAAKGPAGRRELRSTGF